MDTEALLIAAYSAGYFDGEGTVLLTKSNSRSGWQFVCRVTSADVETLNKLHEQWGGSISMMKKAYAHYKQAHAWVLSGTNAYEFAKAILPFCSAKDDQLHVFVGAYEDYREKKGNGKSRDQSFHDRINVMMQHYKLALQALRSFEAFD